MNDISIMRIEASRAVDTPSTRQSSSTTANNAVTEDASGKELPVSSILANELKQTATANQVQGSEPEQSNSELDAAVSQLNDYIQSIQRDIRISIDEEADLPVVHVIDRQTSEVIRQIPSEEALRLAQRLHENDNVSLFEAKI